jgi:hypothetical protein
MELECKACGATLQFEQPYPYHAGFSDNGFLYDDAGTCTLVWSAYDPAWVRFGGDRNPWSLALHEWAPFESVLRVSPSGGRWRASNPARCPKCSEVLRHPMTEGEIYYLVFPDSVILDAAAPGLESVLSGNAAT